MSRRLAKLVLAVTSTRTCLHGAYGYSGWSLMSTFTSLTTVQKQSCLKITFLLGCVLVIELLVLFNPVCVLKHSFCIHLCYKKELELDFKCFVITKYVNNDSKCRESVRIQLFFSGWNDKPQQWVSCRKKVNFVIHWSSWTPNVSLLLICQSGFFLWLERQPWTVTR